jgi:16S rRNA (cytosine967-C5)-methyltransferase
VTPAPARIAAVRALERVTTADAFADLALEAEVTARRLSPRDAGLATELVFGTLRWQRYLDWLLAPHSRRRLDSLDPRVLAILRMTAYQVVFLERVPAFAAVSDAVSLARRRTKPGVAEYVNAVLRSFTRGDGAARAPALPADPMEALAIRHSFPTWLAARWAARHGVEEASRLMAAMNDRPPITIRANTLRCARETLAERLAAEEQLSAVPTQLAPEGLVVERGGAPAAWRAFADGAFAVQDEASMLVARLLAPAPGEVVADACAAPGTKTTHLAQLMENRGTVYALDPHPGRLARVTESAARLGVTIVETRGGTVETLAAELTDACDAVLVDAPCSNLGVLRRNPEVKWRRTEADIAVSAARQREILAAAARMVKRGGRLVYATCSLEPEENEDPPAVFPLALDPDGVLRCRPHLHGTDGFTAVRLQRAPRS